MPMFILKKAFKDLMSACGLGRQKKEKPEERPAQVARAPEEAKARRKAYRRRKAQKAARRRNRRADR